jgi:DNA-binding transcriptional MerR regulator
VSDVDGTEPAPARRSTKSEAAFRTISEVSEDLAVPQHVLRFWESKFSQIKPLKRGGGRRYYRPEDLQLLKRIRDLLYKDGYTIRGVQKLLRDQSRGAPGNGGPRGEPGSAAESPAQLPPAVKPVAAPAESPEEHSLAASIHAQLVDLVDELESLRRVLLVARKRSA